MPLAQEVKALCNASEHLLKASQGLDHFAQQAFTFIEKLVPCEFIALGTLQTKTQTLELTTNRHVVGFDAAMDTLGQIMTQHEMFSWDPSVNNGQAFIRSDFFSEREFRQTDVYSEVLQPIGVDNHCAVLIPEQKDAICYFGIERNGGSDFSQNERELLNLVQPLLGKARELALLQEESHDQTLRPEQFAGSVLTPREAEVLCQIASGKSNDETAARLGIGTHTVKDHLKRIFQKTHTNSRLDASLWAMRMARRYESHPRVRLPRVITAVKNYAYTLSQNYAGK